VQNNNRTILLRLPFIHTKCMDLLVHSLSPGNILKFKSDRENIEKHEKSIILYSYLSIIYFKGIIKWCHTVSMNNKISVSNFKNVILFSVNRLCASKLNAHPFQTISFNCILKKFYK
jgi:hypothetical protein